MEHEQLSKDAAYDKARREFYGERMREEIERRVANEEATATGAYFGRTRLSIGNQLEDEAFETFRGWAQKTLDQTQAARAALYSGLDVSPTSDTNSTNEADLNLTAESEGGNATAPASSR